MACKASPLVRFCSFCCDLAGFPALKAGPLSPGPVVAIDLTSLASLLSPCLKSRLLPLNLTAEVSNLLLQVLGLLRTLFPLCIEPVANLIVVVRYTNLQKQELQYL